jgi:hypothetical protein
MIRARAGVFMILAVVTLALASSSRGDTLGPLLPKGTMEGGIASRSIDRTVTYSMFLEIQSHETRIEQHDIAAFGRYGVTSNATVSFELSATPGDVAFEEANGQLYLVGGAVQLGIWSDIHYTLSFGFHYASFFWRNDDPGKDLEEQLLEFTFQLQRSWSLGQTAGDVWIAPMVSHFSLEAQLPANDTYQEPEDATGGLIGGNARFYEHVGAELQFLWIETSELRVAVFYRF